MLPYAGPCALVAFLADVESAELTTCKCLLAVAFAHWGVAGVHSLAVVVPSADMLQGCC